MGDKESLRYAFRALLLVAILAGAAGVKAYFEWQEKAQIAQRYR